MSPLEEATIARASSTGTLLLGAAEVATLLAGRERELIEIVRATYLSHAAGGTGMPHGSYLKFAHAPDNRIIAKPARVDWPRPVAGVKWVSSFPGNIEHGLERCSAILILNDTDTGHPTAILDCTLINYRRTAAAAALAAATLDRTRQRRTTGIIGCGSVNFEQVRFLLAARSEDRDFQIFDTNADRAHAFAARCAAAYAPLSIRVLPSVDEVLRGCDLVSFATTALDPFVPTLATCAPGTLILHTSLRDLSEAAILSADNVVDDVDHVCSARTSVHRAEQQVGHRRFIRATLGEVLVGHAPVKANPDGVSIFSPFGLAALDVAVGAYVCERAAQLGLGAIDARFTPGR